MKLMILDRDGVINEDSDAYIKSVAEWHPIPGSLEAIAKLTQADWRVYVATNQGAVGRGLMTLDALSAIHDHMQKLCVALGGRIDGIEFAPEHPDQPTNRRKPAPGMLLDIARRLQVTLDGVPFVGDKFDDVLAARAAGARPVLVRTGKGARTEREKALEGVPVYDNLAAFVSDLLNSGTS